MWFGPFRRWLSHDIIEFERQAALAEGALRMRLADALTQAYRDQVVRRLDADGWTMGALAREGLAVGAKMSLRATPTPGEEA